MRRDRRVGRGLSCRSIRDGAALAALIALGAAPAGAAPPNLAELSLEELANIEITSVARRPERLSASPASVYVITAEAIRRSGASTLPQVLRLAPNLQVAQVDARQWAITARGFNNSFGNKLLVMVDGRTVYAPIFSGVFWDQQDLLLEDIERIEVISGPGASLWGANAVNGVINVITRAAGPDDEPLAMLQAGTEDRQVGLRLAGRAGAQGHLRGYAKLSRFGDTKSAAGAPRSDGGRHDQAGFRADWAGSTDHVTLQGDAYEGRHEARALGALPLSALDYRGANVLARWTRRLDHGGDVRVQAYVDRSRRDDPLLYRPTMDIADIEFKHTLAPGRHRLMWGGGYRYARDRIEPGLFFGFRPVQQQQHWPSLFVQDEVQLGEHLSVNLGLKLERNDYTGTENLPSLRLAWQLQPDQLLWAAMSRAVRAPARLDRDLTLPPRPPFIIAGGPDFLSEVAKVLELGYRGKPATTLNASLTAFMHDWDRLRSGQLPPNARVQNMIAGRTYGLEGWGTWQALPALRVAGGFMLLRKDLRVLPGSADPVGPSALGNDPRHQTMLQASWLGVAGHVIDLDVRRVGALPDPAVPAYTAVDLRWTWRPTGRWEVELAARNLLDAAHPEFGGADRAEIRRQALLRLRTTW
jgi:iron complex outermembrane receptor protein